MVYFYQWLVVAIQNLNQLGNTMDSVRFYRQSNTMPKSI